MDTSSFGFWAMIAFWGSAIGGIVIGISWARARGKNPVDRELLIKSLRHRLESGELTREDIARQAAVEPNPCCRGKSCSRLRYFC